MKKLCFLAVFIIIAFLAMTSEGVSAAGGSLQDYIQKHNSRVKHSPAYTNLQINIGLDQFSTSLGHFDDTRLNDDDSPESFKHQYSAQTLLSSDRVLVGWEDDRNGDYDIFGQIVSADGQLSGTNINLISDANFYSQNMPAFDRSATGIIAAVWVDEMGDLYLQVFDSDFSGLSSAILVNDNFTANIISYPNVKFLANNHIVVAWEDTRLNSSIYIQVYDEAYQPLDNNLRTTTNAPGTLYWSPKISAGASGQFAIIWEELGISSASVLLQLFDVDGEPTGIPIDVADLATQSEDQYNPDIEVLTGNRYFIGWSDNRDGGENIYGQVFDQSGNKIDVNFVLSSGTENNTTALDLAVAADGKVLAVWQEINSRSEIMAQVLASDGSLVGNNFIVSDGLAFGERFAPAAIIRSDGTALISFTDTRNGNLQIYAQELANDFLLTGANSQISSASNGSQQTESQIARMAGDDFGVVWSDARNDDGDIYFQRCNELGTKIGTNQKVNDDLSSVFQGDPAIGTSDNGRVITAWVDGREDGGLAGVNIFAQIFNSDGSKVGSNILVNNDAVGSPHLQAEPDCDIAPSGKSVIVWRDGRNSQNDIYFQMFDFNGSPVGGNVWVNQVDKDCFDPAVSMINSEMFVIGWRTLINIRSYVKFQVYNSDGTALDDNLIIPVDTSANEQLDFDLATNPYFGIFALAWINQTETDTEVYGLLVGFDGLAQGSVLILSDLPNLGFEGISMDMDAENSFAVAWSDMRSGIRRSYQGFADGGTIVLSNTLISRNPQAAREQEPSVAINGRQVITSWSDNRNAGEGYDIYTNSNVYNPTSVDDGTDLPLPLAFEVAQNYPNPFNPDTKIDFALTQETELVEFQVFNILGQSVYQERLYDLSAGHHTIDFKADNLASGVYLYKITSGENNVTRKMTLMK